MFLLDRPPTMGTPLPPKGQDDIRKRSSEDMPPIKVHARLRSARRAKRQPGPDLATVRRALKGKTFKRSALEARGRKHILSDKNVKALERARLRLIVGCNMDSDQKLLAQLTSHTRADFVVPRRPQLDRS